MEKITIRAFRAVDEPETCLEFMREHTRVLADLGVDAVVKPDDSWTRDPGTTVFIAEHHELGMVAGIRLEFAWEGKPLRMEKCVAPMAPQVVDLLLNLQPFGNAELCGLWNAHRFAGRGIPALLINAAIACSSQLDLRTVVTFIAEYVAPYAERIGFRPAKEIGEAGRVVYPVPSISTWAMVLHDATTLGNVEADLRRNLISLRIRPRQFRIERPKQAELFVLYDLVLNKSMVTRFDAVLASHRLFAA